MGTNIPLARERLIALGNELDEIGLHSAKERIDEIVDTLMIRHPKVTERGPRRILTTARMRMIKQMYAAGMSQRNIAEHFNINTGRVSEVINGQRDA